MIRIICVGKIKEKFYQDAIKEYQKRLQRYIKLEIIEVEDQDTNDPIVTKRKEKEKIMKYISDKDFVITLEIEGKNLDSCDFSKKINDLLGTYSNITFIIGGSDGIDDEIKERSNYALSFSKMTFPHQLFRVILLEQIYRAFKIIHNESYHK